MCKTGCIPKYQFLQKHSNWNKDQGSFLLPPREALMDYRVIVVTLVTAGRYSTPITTLILLLNLGLFWLCTVL